MVRLAFAALVLAAWPVWPASGQEIVAGIRVHGNTLTSEEEILRLGAITPGMPLDPGTLAGVAERLRATRRFESVEVLKRFASIADPTQVLLVVLVDEGPVRIEWDRDGLVPRVTRRSGPRLMFMPVLDFEDGYGLAYGARFTLPDPAGADSRLSVPLTWGGDRRAAVEFEKGFGGGAPLTRIHAGASISRRTNPFYEEHHERGRIWVRGERELTPALRAGVTGSWEQATFTGRRDRFVGGGMEFVADTRIDPTLARNAVYARAAWDHLHFSDGASLNRTEFEGRGYVGLAGQAVLVVRALRADSDEPMPPYLRPMLGGMQNLRGFGAGSAAGDTLVAGSAELRMPVTSPLNIGKLGVSAFIDAGVVYDEGERLRDQPFERGAGGGIWFSAAVLRLNLQVAHGVGGTTRVHFGTSLLF